MQFDTGFFIICVFSCFDFAVRLQVAVTQHRSILEPAGSLVGVIALLPARFLTCIKVKKRDMSTALQKFWKVIEKQRHLCENWGCRKPVCSLLVFKGYLSPLVPDDLALLHPSYFLMLGSAFQWAVHFVGTVKRWSPEQDGFSVSLWLSCWLAVCFLPPLHFVYSSLCFTLPFHISLSSSSFCLFLDNLLFTFCQVPFF